LIKAFCSYATLHQRQQAAMSPNVRCFNELKWEQMLQSYFNCFQRSEMGADASIHSNGGQKARSSKQSAMPCRANLQARPEQFQINSSSEINIIKSTCKRAKATVPLPKQRLERVVKPPPNKVNECRSPQPDLVIIQGAGRHNSRLRYFGQSMIEANLFPASDFYLASSEEASTCAVLVEKRGSGIPQEDPAPIISIEKALSLPVQGPKHVSKEVEKKCLKHSSVSPGAVGKINCQFLAVPMMVHKTVDTFYAHSHLNDDCFFEDSVYGDDDEASEGFEDLTAVTSDDEWACPLD